MGEKLSLDAISGTQLLAPLRGHESEVYWVAFSSDGTRIVSSDYETIRIWDACLGLEIFNHARRGHCALSPDGRRIASLGQGGTICVWDAESGEDVYSPLRAGGDPVGFISVSWSTDIISAIGRIPSPTILFLKPEHVQSLTSSVIKLAKKSFLMYPLAWRHKFSGLKEGFLGKDSLWDRTVFDGARETVLGRMAETLKAIVISGGPLPFESLTPARIALSVPLINIHTHGSAAGPIFAMHAFDMQMLPAASEPAHVGAPSINIEAKLLGVDDDVVEKGVDPVGEILVRGPPVGSMLSVDGETGEKNVWVHTGEKGRVMTNGAFKVTGFV